MDTWVLGLKPRMTIEIEVEPISHLLNLSRLAPGCIGSVATVKNSGEHNYHTLPASRRFMSYGASRVRPFLKQKAAD